MKAILISVLLFFSIISFGQQAKKDSTTIPVLSMQDMKQITDALQYLPAKEWLKVIKIIDQVYYMKLKQMIKDQPKKDSTSGK